MRTWSSPRRFCVSRFTCFSPAAPPPECGRRVLTDRKRTASFSLALAFAAAGQVRERTPGLSCPQTPTGGLSTCQAGLLINKLSSKWNSLGHCSSPATPRSSATSRSCSGHGCDGASRSAPRVCQPVSGHRRAGAGDHVAPQLQSARHGRPCPPRLQVAPLFKNV